MDQTGSSKIAVVTDSSAGIPQDLIARYGIHVIPQTLKLENRTWQDGVDMTPSEFYDRFSQSKAPLETEAPEPEVLRRLFASLPNDVEGVVMVMPAELFSKVPQLAKDTAASFTGLPVEILDSRGTAMITGFSALAAARTAAGGGDLHRVAEAARIMIDKLRMYFIPGSFHALYRAGKVSRAAKWVGTLLKVKPIFSIENGTTAVVGRPLGDFTLREELSKLIDQQLARKERVHMSIFHANDAFRCEQVKKELHAKFQPVELVEAELSPVLGYLGGTGSFGVVVYEE